MTYVINSGGFILFEIIKESNGFVKTKLTSGNLRYKESETTWIPPTYSTNPWSWQREKIMEGYTRNNYRPNVQLCYDRSFEFLVKGNENNPKFSYKPGTFTELKNFPEMYSSKYYYVGREIHPTEFYDSQVGSGQVYTSSYELDYEVEKYYYQIKPRSNETQMIKLIYTGGGLGIGLILTLLSTFFLKSPKLEPRSQLYLFNKKWKNKEDNSILILTLPPFGKCKATLVKGNKSIIGIATITDECIELKFTGLEYYYTIIKLSEEELILSDIVSNKVFNYQNLEIKK